jgi:predicted acetyltransferase
VNLEDDFVDLVVNVSLVSENDKLVLRNLLDLYLYDLSEFKGTDVNGHGYFEYRRLDQYWYDDSCHPFFITADGHIAGFVLVHRYGLLGENRNVVSEFFVMRKYRKLGVGKQAVRRIFETFKGGWEVSELPENLPSHIFWRRVISELTNGKYSETVIEGRPVQYFEI